jgi:hypothetical protein
MIQMIWRRRVLKIIQALRTATALSPQTVRIMTSGWWKLVDLIKAQRAWMEELEVIHYVTVRLEFFQTMSCIVQCSVTKNLRALSKPCIVLIETSGLKEKIYSDRRVDGRLVDQSSARSKNLVFLS